MTDSIVKEWPLFTVSGERLFLSQPDFEKISLIDLAVGLSRQNRYSGATRKAYNVATHSVLCSLYAEQVLQASQAICYGVLMHDASEAFLGDIAQPLKRRLLDYQRIEELWQRGLEKRFNVECAPELYSAVKACDRALFRFETVTITSGTCEDFGVSRAETLAEYADACGKCPALLDLSSPWSEYTSISRFVERAARLQPRAL